MKRLANALETELQADHPVIPLALRFRNRLSSSFSRATERVNMLQFLQLQDCAAGALVGERNSSLGRVQGFSQRWRYDVQLVEALSDCSGTAGCSLGNS